MMPEQADVTRTGLASLLFAIFRPRDARGVAVDSENVRLVFDKSPVIVSLGHLLEAELTEGLFWSCLHLHHSTGSARISGLSRKAATGLAAAVETARHHWWQQFLASLVITLEPVHKRILTLLDPPKYFTMAEMRELELQARNVASRIAGRWPGSLANAQEIRKLQDILAFLNAPGQARIKANDRYLTNELVRSRKLLDTIEARPLTDEQRRAVVIDEHRNLVIAAAGSGKTSVIVAKTAWLLHRGDRKPSELLLLAFARDARDEMKERIQARIDTTSCSRLTVSTFHSLGMGIIGKAEGKRPSLSRVAENQNDLLGILKSIITDLFADSKLSSILRQWFQSQFAPYKSRHEFKNWGEYFDYIRKFDIRTLQGETVKSLEELYIANYLYCHGVEYKYEAPYEHDTATAAKRQYKPDFHLPEHGIYIEHFGINAEGKTAPFVNQEQYVQGMQWKRQLHVTHQTVLIETFSHEQADGKLLRNLAKKLTARGVTLKPVPQEQILKVLQQQDRINPFTRLVATFLQHFKGSRLSLSDLAERTVNPRASAFLAVFTPIFERYQQMLAGSREIDFHDMINRATSLVESGRFNSPFKYILVDEFQDISPSRAALLKALLDHSPDAQLFAVGDDWQAIYRFAGSDIAVMQDFGNRFGDYQRTDLETTFRCTDHVAEVAAEFVLRNPAQIRKKVHATNKADRPAVHIGLPDDHSLSLLKEALDRIADHAKNHSGTSEVLLLGRYKHLRPRHLPTLKSQYPGLCFCWKTIHGCKGLETDYAVVLGLCTGKYGFPSEIDDDPLLDLVLAAPETHPNAEERRLLYVAITRARRQVYLLADGGAPSSFVNELIGQGYNVEVFGRAPEADVPCPVCIKGTLQRRENANNGNVFYGCSNYPLCEHTVRACPKCGNGLPIRADDTWHCRDCGVTIETCPACQGWLEDKIGKYGRFLGCSNFPECKYTGNLQ